MKRLNGGKQMRSDWALNICLGEGQLGIYIAILAGLVAGVLIGKVTEYYTSDTYKPTQKLASSSETGSATIIISGLLILWYRKTEKQLTGIKEESV